MGTLRVGRLTAAAPALLLLASVACSGNGKDPANGAAPTPCDGLLEPADPAAALPATIPSGVSGATFYEVEAQGATKRYFAYVAGTDIVRARDEIRAAYEAAGIEIVSTDQEAGAEADLEFKAGTEEGTVQVIPLCQGTLRLRYRVGPA